MQEEHAMKTLEEFYDECIRMKIQQCDLKSSRLNKRSHCGKRRAEIHRAQAAFFEDHREYLIHKMLHNGVGRDLGKISGALINAFVQAFPARVSSLNSDLEYLELLHEEYPKDVESRKKMNEPIVLEYRHLRQPNKLKYLHDLSWTDAFSFGDDE
jgi:hypothetical protein